MSDGEKGFVIRDRRHFAQGEEAAEPSNAEDRTTEKESETTPDRERSQQEAARQYSEANRQGPCREHPPLPEVNFSTFVFSLGTSALMHMGELPDPNTRQRCENLALAKQTIDILAMLQARTKGNLDDEEENLLSNLLYELRMKFVSATRAS